MSEQLPNLDPALLGDPPPVSGHRPRILLLMPRAKSTGGDVR